MVTLACCGYIRMEGLQTNWAIHELGSAWAQLKVLMNKLELCKARLEPARKLGYIYLILGFLHFVHSLSGHLRSSSSTERGDLTLRHPESHSLAVRPLILRPPPVVDLLHYLVRNLTFSLSPLSKSLLHLRSDLWWNHLYQVSISNVKGHQREILTW